MERSITITQCDVCGRRKYETYSYLQNDGWTKYKIAKEWSSGDHSGTRVGEIIVCPKCNGQKGVRHFFFKILKPFLRRVPERSNVTETDEEMVPVTKP